MRIEAFSGRVIFDCYPPVMKVSVVQFAMERAIPEAVDFPLGSDPSILFSNLIQFLGRTQDIEVRDGDPDEDIEALAAFWSFTRVSTDYRAIWDNYLMMRPIVNNEWNTALVQVEDKRLKAPSDLQPNAPPDDQLEESGQKKDLTTEPNTSKGLTKRRGRSSPRVATGTHSS